MWKRKIRNLYKRYTGYHERAFDLIKKEYNEFCLQVEFKMLEAKERIDSYRVTLTTIAKTTNAKVCRDLAQKELDK